MSLRERLEALVAEKDLGPRRDEARAAFAFRSCSLCAFTFWTSGWPSLNFSPRRPSSTARAASCVLNDVPVGSTATWGRASSSWPAPLISPACLSAASMVIRRAWAWTKSSFSLAIEVETAETLPSGTKRSWLL